MKHLTSQIRYYEQKRASIARREAQQMSSSEDKKQEQSSENLQHGKSPEAVENSESSLDLDDVNAIDVECILGQCRAPRLNSGNFDVPWLSTKKILREGSLDIVAVRPRRKPGLPHVMTTPEEDTSQDNAGEDKSSGKSIARVSEEDKKSEGSDQEVSEQDSVSNRVLHKSTESKSNTQNKTQPIKSSPTPAQKLQPTIGVKRKRDKSSDDEFEPPTKCHR